MDTNTAIASKPNLILNLSNKSHVVLDFTTNLINTGNLTYYVLFCTVSSVSLLFLTNDQKEM